MRKSVKIFLAISGILILTGCIGAFLAYRYVNQRYDGENKRIYISASSTPEALHKLLVDSLGVKYGDAVYKTWNLRKGNIARTHGSYLVKTGETALKLGTRLRGGAQNPVKVTIANRRNEREALEQIASNFEFTPAQLENALDSILTSRNIDLRYRSAIILPDSYEFYWTATPTYVADYITGQWNKFWTDSRKQKAAALRLTPFEVSVLASIVEEETAKSDERPVVARLYLNRLERNMRLQADPTVKYAVGDPTLRRILNQHLATESPYNTYMVDGLPPGPIRMVDKSTLEAVLNAPTHNYLYMCAKEDFSGYHNFATNLSTHNANAARYHAALNARNIR
ncbi:MAG: endolytic transglycosylase MltG, partial [Muribaculaceae bacterium]|nr:endolytic transglycosylase MltG [Muribaculaceae bacterium]